MQITSSAFEMNTPIPSHYTCDGDNINPPLTLSDIPEGTQSLALIMDDPDAPNGDWVHWLIWNMPPQTAEIPMRSVPRGAVEGTTSAGKPGYSGPCPPSGTHRYFFKLYALDTTIGLEAFGTKPQLLGAMENHIIDQAELMGTYSRTQ